MNRRGFFSVIFAGLLALFGFKPKPRIHIRKGRHPLEAGYIWAPYIPMCITSATPELSELALRPGVEERYSQKTLNPSYYGTIEIKHDA